MGRSKFVRGFILGVLITVVISFVYISTIQVNSIYPNQGGTDSNVLDAVSESKISAIEQLIDTYYLEDVDYDELTESTYAGLLEGLGDPYSVYYTVEEYQDLVETTSGTYYGIGVTVQQNVDTGIITVVSTFSGSPGEEAGIQPGDIIYAVEGEEISDKDLTTVVAKIKGEEGTEVNITVYRDEEYIDMTIVRSQIEIVTVSGEMLQGNVGYIDISEFEEKTYDQFVSIYEELESEGMEAVVFDLRDNPGGLYDTVVDVLDYILPEGRIIYTQDKYGVEESEYSDASCIDIPIAVIINENTASAAEIFAGAIKDYGVGTIVGTTSFGKGIVQRIFPLSDGSAIKLTVSKYYTPNGTNIHGIGITPDVEIELDEELADQLEISHDEDNQLQAAIDTLF